VRGAFSLDRKGGLARWAGGLFPRREA